MRERKLQMNPDHLLSLTLLPCGTVDQTELNDLAQRLSAKGEDVRIAKQRALPHETFDARRQQYRADDFLNIARTEVGDRVLAVTNCDLYADNLNHVLGLAESFGKCAVISLGRLRIGADGKVSQSRCERSDPYGCLSAKDITP